MIYVQLYKEYLNKFIDVHYWKVQTPDPAWFVEVKSAKIFSSVLLKTEFINLKIKENKLELSWVKLG